MHEYSYLLPILEPIIATGVQSFMCGRMCMFVFSVALLACCSCCWCIELEVGLAFGFVFMFEWAT